MKMALRFAYGLIAMLTGAPFASNAMAYTCTPPPAQYQCMTKVYVPADDTCEPRAKTFGTVCNTWGYCNGTDLTCIMPANGTIWPKFYIASVTYSPPAVGSSVTYSAGTKIGTTTSTTHGWENTVSAQYKAGLSVPLFGGDTTFSFERVWGASSTNATDVVQSINSTVTVHCDPASGQCSDYINHDYDQINLLFGIKINLLTYASATGLPPGMSQVRWGLDFSQSIPQVVKVGWLTGSIPMPGSVAATLATHGITSADYQEILKSSPFSNDPTGMTAPPPDRFEYVTSFPYEPTLPNDYSWDTQNNYTLTNSAQSSVRYSAGASWQGAVLSQEVTVAGKHTWTESSSSVNSQSDTNSMNVSVSMPSSAYSGPTDVYLYIDRVYKTLLFSFIPPQ